MCKPISIDLIKSEERNRPLLIKLAKELKLASSSLYMESEPIPGSEGPYLVDKEVWVKHSNEHIEAAREITLELLKRIGCGKMD